MPHYDVKDKTEKFNEFLSRSNNEAVTQLARFSLFHRPSSEVGNSRPADLIMPDGTSEKSRCNV